jgi:hypothetical protein
MGPYDTDKWFVCYGPDVVRFVKLNAGSLMGTGYPNCEEFNDEASGLARAKELGYVNPEGE